MSSKTPKIEYYAIGNEVFNRRGMHITSISFAPQGDLAKMAHKVANLMNLEHAMAFKSVYQQGIDSERERRYDVV